MSYFSLKSNHEERVYKKLADYHSNRAQCTKVFFVYFVKNICCGSQSIIQPCASSNVNSSISELHFRISYINLSGGNKIYDVVTLELWFQMVCLISMLTELRNTHYISNAY